MLPWQPDAKDVSPLWRDHAPDSAPASSCGGRPPFAIPKAPSPKRAAENAGACALRPAEADLARIDAAFPPGPGRGGLGAGTEAPMSYGKFAGMIIASTIVMFFLMYLNTWALDHVFFSQTRVWIALLMGAAMAILMMAFMWGMYPDPGINCAVIVVATIAGATSLWLVRSQATVSDVAYMKAMIPHHSIAVMTSDRAHIRDPRVRKLADGILQTQVKEIGEMKGLIEELGAAPSPAGAPVLRPAQVGQ